MIYNYSYNNILYIIRTEGILYIIIITRRMQPMRRLNINK